MKLPIHKLKNLYPVVTNTYSLVSEEMLQEHVISFARWHKWRIFHTRPAKKQNGEWTTPMMGDRGFPDLILLRKHRAIAVELKSEIGKVEEEQQKWLDAFVDAGYEVHVWRPSDIDKLEVILK